MIKYPIYTDDFMYDEMKIYEIPKFLYHYTSLDTLKLILKNRTIRFNRLDRVNDPNEARTLNLPNSNTAVFVSSWSDEEEESLKMWEMYGDNLKGVRLKFPTNMFYGRNDPIVFEKGGCHVRYGRKIKIDRQDLTYPMETSLIIGPNKVCYTEEIDKLVSQAIYNSEEYSVASLYDLGQFKTLEWSYENEWRYKIVAFFNEFSLPNDKFTKDIFDLNKFPIIQEYIDVDLDSTIMNEIEITFGLEVTNDEINIFKNFLKTNNIACSLKNSTVETYV